MVRIEWTHDDKAYVMTSIGADPRMEQWIIQAGGLLTDAWQTPFQMRMGDHVLTEMVRRGLAERKHPPSPITSVCLYRRPRSH
jgi:hypothetical protein